MNTPMTKEKLSRLCALRREITRTKRRLAHLSEVKTEDPEALSLAKMQTAAALSAYLLNAEREQAALLGYINSIGDADVREIFMLRYVDGIRSWQRIAFLVGEHDESYVRRKHNAFLRTQNAEFSQKDGKRCADVVK